MKRARLACSAALCAALGCSSGDVQGPDHNGGPAVTGAGGASSGPGSSSSGGGLPTSEGSGGAGSGGGAASARDPNADGPYAIAELNDATYVAASTRHAVPMYCAYPKEQSTASPAPVVIFAHGFQLKPDQYKSYAKRLATFGYVTVVPDFDTPLFSQDNNAEAKDFLSAIDWVATRSELMGKIDVAKTGVGATGHSLGGKLAVLAASLDPRIKAVIALDPVDGAPPNPGNPNPTCTSPCVQVSAKLPLNIPTGFLGETLASSGVKQSPPIPDFPPCAPAGQNYTTLYAKTTSPSLSVTVVGASHMSFLDNADCGFTCSACVPATTPNATVNALSRAFVVAFFERYLRGATAYDAYLTGAEAKARYETTGLATIEAK